MKAKKRKITFQEALKISSRQFDPIRLSSFLKSDRGIQVVDKKRAIQSDEEEQAFYWLLNQDYKWNYIADRENVTIYMEAEDVNTDDYEGKVVYCGVYDEQEHKKLTRIFMASLFPARLPSRYIYTEEKMTELIKNISGNY